MCENFVLCENLKTCLYRERVKRFAENSPPTTVFNPLSQKPYNPKSLGHEAMSWKNSYLIRLPEAFGCCKSHYRATYKAFVEMD